MNASVFSLIRPLLAGGLMLAALASGALAQAPPATFTRTLTSGAQSMEIHFTLHPVRSANFRVHVQQADGSFVDHVADVERSYLGRVPSRPGAIAAALLRADNTLLARVSLEDGTTWTTTGGAVSIDSDPFTPAWPTTVVPAGGAGSTVFAAEVGFDSTFNHFTACGGTPAAVLERCEFALASVNMIYLRDSAILHRLGRLVIRADAAQDPYATDGGDTGLLLTRVRTQWNAGAPMGTAHDIAAVLHSGANGGLAYVGTIGSSSRYSSNDSDSAGDFSVVWRHEAGHNWSSSHYEGGGNPEGDTIMSNNGLSRFSSSENRKIISHRVSRTASLDNLGSYPLPLPPRANQDTAAYLRQKPVRVDVMANDSDSNGEALTLLSFDSDSALGGKLARSAGTGPGGRDEITYTPPARQASGTDWFRYRIRDAAGYEAVGYAMLRPRREIYTLADHWKLDDTAGTTAVNAVRPAQNGTHQNGPLTNQPGANAVTRTGAFFDGSNDRTSIPAPNYATNVLSFTVWVQRSGAQNANAALIFTRAGSSVAGLHFGSANELRYTWDGAGFTFAPAPALTVPDNTWCLAALCVSPTGATLHLRTPAGLQSATHTATLAAEAFNGLMYLGQDTNSATRCFRGRMDDVRIYANTLTADDIESLYQQAAVPPLVSLAQPVNGAVVSPLNTAFTATVGSQVTLVDQVDFLAGSNVIGTASQLPWQASAPVLAPGSLTVRAGASFGDWGYVMESAPVTLTVENPPLPVVRAAAPLPASKRGPVPGAFTLVRDHPIGSITVPFTLSGTAVAGTDYEPLTVSSVTFADGSLTATVPVIPIAAAADGLVETVVLTIGSGAGWTLGTPASATLALDDHITSIATGAWTLPETWNSAAAAPVTGTQNTGLGYAVASGHVVTSNNTASNTQALVAGSLRVKNGGVLDLARLHDGTLVTGNYNLPATTVEDGGTLQFRASNGSSAHAIAAALTFSGNTTLRITGGGYENYASFAGAVSGSGTIAVNSVSNAGGGSAFVRRVSVNSANNPFSGNWTVSHVDSGDDFGGLRAGAANALGTGLVTVGTRSQLINDHATGLNSLSGVVLSGEASSLRLVQPWNRPAAGLSLQHPGALVQLGNAASSIGHFSGFAGTVQGTGTSSSLTVNPVSDGWFGGTLGANLTFVKSGPALLQVDGPLHPGLRLQVGQGTLVYGSASSTVTSLTQSGGVLAMDLPAPAVVPLRTSGNFTRTGGTLRIALPAGGPVQGTPYTLLAWQGTRSGQPVIEFSPPHAALIDYGATTNSQLQVTFYTPVTLTVSASPPAGGSVTGSGGFPDGSSQPVTATPAADWQFTGWTGSGIANPASASTTVTLSGPQALTANFVNLYDQWASSFNLTGPAAARGADPDGDGMVNAHERAFGFDPANSNSALLMEPVRLPDGSLRLIINKVIPTGTFTLQWSTTPGAAWTGNQVLPITLTSTDFPVTPPLPGSRGFYRLVYAAPAE